MKTNKKAQGLAEFAIVAAVVSVIALAAAGPMTEPIKQMFSGMFSSSHTDQNRENQINTAFSNTRGVIAGIVSGEVSGPLTEIFNQLYSFSQSPLNKMDMTETAGSLADLIRRIASMPPGAERDALMAKLEEMENLIESEALVSACTESTKACEKELTEYQHEVVTTNLAQLESRKNAFTSNIETANENLYHHTMYNLCGDYNNTTSLLRNALNAGFVTDNYEEYYQHIETLNARAVEWKETLEKYKASGEVYLSDIFTQWADRAVLDSEDKLANAQQYFQESLSKTRFASAIQSNIQSSNSAYNEAQATLTTASLQETTISFLNTKLQETTTEYNELMTLYPEAENW